MPAARPTGVQRLIPASEDVVLLDLVRFQHQAAGRFGDAIKPEAVFEVEPDLIEGGAAQHRRDPVEPLREGQDLRGLVHQDDAACRVRGRVEPGDPGCHRVAHDHRALDAQCLQEPVGLLATSSGGAGSPPLSPCAGRSIAMLVTEPSSWSMTGRHVWRPKSVRTGRRPACPLPRCRRPGRSPGLPRLPWRTPRKGFVTGWRAYPGGVNRRERCAQSGVPPLVFAVWGCRCSRADAGAWAPHRW